MRNRLLLLLLALLYGAGALGAQGAMRQGVQVRAGASLLAAPFVGIAAGESYGVAWTGLYQKGTHWDLEFGAGLFHSKLILPIRGAGGNTGHLEHAGYLSMPLSVAGRRWTAVRDAGWFFQVGGQLAIQLWGYDWRTDRVKGESLWPGFGKSSAEAKAEGRVPLSPLVPMLLVGGGYRFSSHPVEVSLELGNDLMGRTDIHDFDPLYPLYGMKYVGFRATWWF